MKVVEIEYNIKEKRGHKIFNSQGVFEVLKNKFNPLQEQFFLLPHVNKEIAVEILFTGGVNSSTVDLKTIFHILLVKYPNCSHFLIAHNHPGGSLEPSLNDKQITLAIHNACKIFGYTLQDHIIFTDTDYYSFADNGELL